jgi:hypothetical protein
LEDENKKATCGVGQKRKAVNDAVEELKKKKKCVQINIDAMLT